MLEFLYARQIYSGELPIEAKTYCLAQKLGLEQLKNTAFANLQMQMQGLENSPEHWALLVREIYANTHEDDEIRGEVITGVSRDLPRLLVDKDSEFSQMMLDVAEF